MRICFLLHQGNMYSGGQGVYLAALCREYIALGHEVHAVVGPPYPDLDRGVTQHRVESFSAYHQLEAGAGFWQRAPVRYFEPLNLLELATSRVGMFSVMAAFSMRAFEVVAREHARQPYDLVHDNQSLGYGDLLIRRLGVPVVANIHHPLAIDRRNGIREARGLRAQVSRAIFYPFAMQSIVARRVHRVISGSRASAGAVEGAFGLVPGQVAPVLDGVDVGRFFPSSSPRDPGRILFVGNSDDRNKGARYLVEALAQVSGHDWRLVVVDRAEARVVRKRAGELGVADRVTLTGRLSAAELRTEYQRAALLASPSLYEGFGLPAAEAQACGTPVVATTAGALPEVVIDGETGMLVPPGDAGALAEAIGALLGDAAERERLGANGAHHIATNLTWRQTAEATLALYEEVIGAATRRSRWRASGGDSRR